MKKFEYLLRYVELRQPVTSVKTLNGLGQEGWELIAILHDIGYFKRELVESYEPLAVLNEDY
jgi:hypothetical protein